MRTKERFIVYGALIGLAAAMVAQFPGSTAHATRLAADLGPADALILSGKDGDLTLKNGAGRVQWGDQPTAKAWAIGAVNRDRIMVALLQSDRSKEERKEIEDEARAKDEEFRKRYKDLQDKYQDMDPRSPSEDAQREMSAFYTEANEWRTAVTQKFAKMRAGQIEKAFRDLASAVDLVADRQKVDLVLNFVPPAAKFDAEPSMDEESDEGHDPTEMRLDIMMQVRARSILHAPDALDMTAEVMKELGLKDS